MWGKGPQTISGYWLQRVIPAVSLTLGHMFACIASFQYEKEMGNNAGPRPGIDEDQGDFHEAFIDISTGLDDQRSITARLGQQEIVYGTGRLVDNNEGVNVKVELLRRKNHRQTETLRLEMFGVKPTEQNTGTFDDRPTSQQTFWGAYGTVPLHLIDAAARPISITWDSTQHALPIEQGSGRENPSQYRRAVIQSSSGRAV